MKSVLITALLILSALAVGLYLLPRELILLQPAYADAAAIGWPFQLADQNGRRFTEKDLRGKYSLVFFGFTHCPSVCPTTLLTMTQVMKGLGNEGKNIRPVFISVDAGDTPESMKAYLSNFHSAIVGLTGSEAEIKRAAEAYKAYYAKIEQPDTALGYTIDHSAYIYLMDADGRYLTHFDYQESADKIIATLKLYLEKPL